MRAFSTCEGPSWEGKYVNAQMGTRRRTSAAATSHPRGGRGASKREALLLGHEGVAVVERRAERLLDRAGAHPPDEVELGARLVVRARSPRAAERLLAHHRARGLVVHVEVARGLAQRRRGLADRRPILGEDRPRERVGRRLVDDAERVFPLLVRIHPDRDHRAEDLLAEEAIPGLTSFHERGLDEEALL